MWAPLAPPRTDEARLAPRGFAGRLRTALPGFAVFLDFLPAIAAASFPYNTHIARRRRRDAFAIAILPISNASGGDRLLRMAIRIVYCET